MKVLVTGGSGFVAAHCIDQLLKAGHHVVFTVRTTEKGQNIIRNHRETSTKKLSFVVVEDIAAKGAFDTAVQSEPPFEGVLHTASPFHFNVTDVKRDMLDPAINGTRGILWSIKKYAPGVSRVVLTSSFAAMARHGNHPAIYDESVWSSLTAHDAELQGPFVAYSASKTLAEQAAWDFMDQEQPNFTLTTLTPPAVFGPVVHYLDSLNAINTSNTLTRDLIQGKMKNSLPHSPIFLWIDVRDLATAHVKALAEPKAKGKRIFVVAGFYRNSEIADAINKNFPQLQDRLPANYAAEPLSFPYEIDNSLSKEILGIQYRSLDECVRDSVNAMLAFKA
ncbi:hypothetical protein LTR84_004212 [Exophiala bonariae]|uniref:NAD-dependent epimerase/dehydratase domain-containing protein n=1 Tax=Exophiala bonariae TaxID=1690606 RepID=A0AAV9N9A9_9EURO|nr:hypothetical protein LTR84_004212 [Exophiala bonariae]